MVSPPPSPDVIAAARSVASGGRLQERFPSQASPPEDGIPEFVCGECRLTAFRGAPKHTQRDMPATKTAMKPEPPSGAATP